MKKIFTLVALMTCGIAAMAQGLASTPFTAELRDANGDLMRAAYIGYKYTINSIDVEGAVIERSGYAETDENGVLSLNLGVDGTPTFNNTLANLSEFPFEKVSSSSNNVFLSMRIDPQGGTNYTISGMSSLSVAVPFAEYSKKSEEANALGDISLATVNVSIENETGVSCAVAIAGKRILSGSKEVKVPAYMPVYLNVACGSYDNVHYEVLINGKPFDNIAGKYWVTNETVVRTYTKDKNQNYDYFYVRDNFDGPESAEMKYTDGRQTEGYGNATSIDDVNSAPDFVPTIGSFYNNTSTPASHFTYENPIYVDSRYDKGVDWAEMSNDAVGYEVSEFNHISGQYNRDYSPLFVKIPVPILSVQKSLVESYKVGNHPSELGANMVNQIIGPFTGTSNTIVIKVKNTPAQSVVY